MRGIRAQCPHIFLPTIRSVRVCSPFVPVDHSGSGSGSIHARFSVRHVRARGLDTKNADRCNSGNTTPPTNNNSSSSVSSPTTATTSSLTTTTTTTACAHLPILQHARYNHRAPARLRQPLSLRDVPLRQTSGSIIFLQAIPPILLVVARRQSSHTPGGVSALHSVERGPAMIPPG